MRTAAIAFVAFLIGLLLVGGGGFQLRFLWVAYQHGGL
jgi:hypothetical protein